MTKPQARRAQRGFTVEEVVRAALLELDSAGAEEFSVRGVARRLETYPATITWHAGRREDLLGLVIEHVLSTVVPAPSPADWEGWIRALANRYRAAVGSHPQVARVIGARLVPGPWSLEVVEGIAAHLEAAGFTGHTLSAAMNMTITVIVGFVTLETVPPPIGDEAPLGERYQEVLSHLNENAYPTVARHRDVLVGATFGLRHRASSPGELDASFATAIEGLIAGLRGLLKGE